MGSQAGHSQRRVAVIGSGQSGLYTAEIALGPSRDGAQRIKIAERDGMLHAAHGATVTGAE